MGNIKKICPKCQEVVSFREDQDFGFCSFCGEKIYLSQEGKVVNTEDNISEVREASEKYYKLIEDGEAYLKLGDTYNARRSIQSAMKEEPDQPKSYEMLIYAISQGYTDFQMEAFKQVMDLTHKLSKLAPNSSEYKRVAPKSEAYFDVVRKIDECQERRDDLVNARKNLKRDVAYFAIALIVFAITIVMVIGNFGSMLMLFPILLIAGAITFIFAFVIQRNVQRIQDESEQIAGDEKEIEADKRKLASIV